MAEGSIILFVKKLQCNFLKNLTCYICHDSKIFNYQDCLVASYLAVSVVPCSVIVLYIIIYVRLLAIDDYYKRASNVIIWGSDCLLVMLL